MRPLPIYLEQHFSHQRSEVVETMLTERLSSGFVLLENCAGKQSTQLIAGKGYPFSIGSIN